MRDTFIKILLLIGKLIALPILVCLAPLFSVVFIFYYWYYWAFKPEQLYTKINLDE